MFVCLSHALSSEIKFGVKVGTLNSRAYTEKHRSILSLVVGGLHSCKGEYNFFFLENNHVGYQMISELESDHFFDVEMGNS